MKGKKVMSMSMRLVKGSSLWVAFIERECSDPQYSLRVSNIYISVLHGPFDHFQYWFNIPRNVSALQRGKLEFEERVVHNQS